MSKVHQFISRLPADSMTDGQHRILRTLADFADASGRRVYPSMATLIERTAKRRRTIERAISLFLARGWLQVVRRRGSGTLEFAFALEPSGSCGKPVQNMLKGCGNHAAGATVGSRVWDPTIAIWDPTVDNFAASASADGSSTPDLPMIRGTDQIKNEEAPLRDAPLLKTLQSDTALSTAAPDPKRAALEQLQMLKARLAAPASPNRHRRRSR